MPRARTFPVLLLFLSACLPAAAQESDTAPLITRDQVKLNLAGAERILQAAQAQAEKMKLKVNIAVVDDGGHLIAFSRMDGARPASVYTALTKATTAATLRQDTGPLPPGATQPDVWLNLSVQNAAAMSGGKFTTLRGGVAIALDGQVIGASESAVRQASRTPKSPAPGLRRSWPRSIRNSGAQWICR